MATTLTTRTILGRVVSSLSVSQEVHTWVTATHTGEEDAKATVRCVGTTAGIQQAARDAHAQVVLAVIALRGL